MACFFASLTPGAVQQQNRDREERARMEDERNRLARERDELEARLRQVRG